MEQKQFIEIIFDNWLIRHSVTAKINSLFAEMYKWFRERLSTENAKYFSYLLFRMQNTK